jgi:hypothetical protein
LLLPRSSAPLEGGDRLSELLDAQLAGEAHMPPPWTADTQVFAPRIPSTSFVLRILWKGGLDHRPMQTIIVEEKSPWLDEKPWEASAVVELDEYGTVHHVFLERATASHERNAAIVRVLKGFRAGPPLPARTGRVVIRYENDALPSMPLPEPPR